MKSKKEKIWTPHKYLVADARKRWRYSPARNEALKRAKADVGEWRCTECLTVVGTIKYLTKRGRKASKVDGAVDHIVPVGTQPRDWDDYPSYYRRMFCPTENLAFLCSKCHDAKTAVERQARVAARKALKEKP
jgi:5-methylcytosine-specific restriction endonuclease McrA